MRTDLSIVQLPSTLPAFGGAVGKNIIQVDPDFKQPIVRLSDSTDKSGSTIKTADGASAGLWNHNDTMFLARATGGWPILYQFNPSTMQGMRVPLLVMNGGNISFCFSRVNAAVLYALQGTKVFKILFTKDINGNWVSPTTASLVCDFAKVLPTGFIVKSSSAFLVSYDDTTFGVALSSGIQNTAIYCCVYQTGHAGAGYRLLNTQTGIITGGWGTLGPVSLSSPTFKFPFTMHEFWMTPNPNFATIVPYQTKGTQLIWNIPNNTIVDPSNSGHQGYGMQHLYVGGPGGGQIAEFAYSNLAKRLVIPASGLPSGQSPVQTYAGDQHFAIGHIDPLDNTKVWVSSQSQVYPFTSAWMNEIRGIRIIDGVVFRACHTFNSGLSKEFITQNAIAIPSQSGNFVAFSSDMMQTLGMDSNGNFRGDIFVVKTV